jgi:hypothetical protein
MKNARQVLGGIIGWWKYQTNCRSSQNYWFFGLFPSSDILETSKLDISETGSVSVLGWRGEKTPTQLGSLERANLNHWTGIFSPFTWVRKQIHFPKCRVFQSLEYRTMEKVQKPSNFVCYTPLSEPFRINCRRLIIVDCWHTAHRTVNSFDCRDSKLLLYMQILAGTIIKDFACTKHLSPLNNFIAQQATIFYNYCVSGHRPLSCFYLKHNVSETEFCLCLQVEPTQLGPIDRDSPHLWTLDLTSIIFVLVFPSWTPKSTIIQKNTAMR